MIMNSAKESVISPRIVGLFSGAGGLDLGFKNAGFNIIWANEYDKSIWATYRHNHKNTELDTRSIVDIPDSDVPDCDGIIGGPPCQSWSEAGALRGIEDKRGQLFFEFIRLIKAKQPKFFLAENVSGMLAPRHSNALQNIISMFAECGYDIKYKLLNVSNYGVPQDRKRVIFVGFRSDLRIDYQYPSYIGEKKFLKDAIYDLRNSAVPAGDKNHRSNKCKIPNHEYMTGGFSTIYLSRNRVRNWGEPSFTIQAGGRHAPIHPQAPKMIKIGANEQTFEKGSEHLYRRLSIRECARIQTFPDDFEFIYDRVADGYKMIGNAVPVSFAHQLASTIKKLL